MLFHFKNNTATLWKLHPSQMNFCLSPSTSPFLSGTMPSVSEPRAVGRSHGSLNEAAFPYAHRSHTDIFMIVPILQFPSAFTTQGDICVFSYLFATLNWAPLYKVFPHLRLKVAWKWGQCGKKRDGSPGDCDSSGPNASGLQHLTTRAEPAQNGSILLNEILSCFSGTTDWNCKSCSPSMRRGEKLWPPAAPGKKSHFPSPRNWRSRT